MYEIIDSARGFHTDEETRVVVFTGPATCFSAGVDLTDIKGIGRVENTSALMKSRLLGLGPRMIRIIYEMDQIAMPIIHSR